jgi:hypothetical protein
VIINKTTKEQRSRPWSVSAGSFNLSPPLLWSPSSFKCSIEALFPLPVGEGQALSSWILPYTQSLGMASPASTCQLAWPLSPSLGVYMIAHCCYHHHSLNPWLQCSMLCSTLVLVHQMCVLHRQSPPLLYQEPGEIASPNHVAERCKAIFSLVRCCCRADWEREKNKKTRRNKTATRPLFFSKHLLFYLYILICIHITKRERERGWGGWPDSDATRPKWQSAQPDATGRSCRWRYKPPASSGSRGPPAVLLRIDRDVWQARHFCVLRVPCQQTPHHGRSSSSALCYA